VLVSRVTLEERAAHDAFVTRELKDAAIWLRFAG
jgi:hypothetical protein